MILREILIILGLILINGFFAMAEVAIISARKTKLQSDLNKGDKRAKRALKIINAPKHALSTVQVGITVVSVIASVYGGVIIAEAIYHSIKDMPFLAGYSRPLSYGVVVILISYLSLVLGELFPKRLGLAYPETIAKLVSPILSAVAKAFRPLVWLLNISTDFLERMLFLKTKADEARIEDEIRVMLAKGRESGVIHRQEEKIVSKAFRLDDRRASSIMTPRKDIEWMDVNDPLEKIWKEVAESTHTHFVLADGEIDHVLGMVALKDFSNMMVSDGSKDIRKIAREPLQAAAGMNLLKLLELFKSKKKHLALVYDEHGGLDGLITTHDLMEALVGELSDSPDDEPAHQRRPDGSHLVDAGMDLDELFSLIGLPLVLHEDHKGYHSLGGFVLKHLGHVPVEGENFEYMGFKFEVIDMDRHRVDKVLVSKRREQPPEDAD